MRSATKVVLTLSASLGIAALALASPSRSQVSQPGPPMPPAPPYPSYCYNVDITNATGQGANDLHVTLSGPTAIYSFYGGSDFGLPSHAGQNADGTWGVDYVLSSGYVGAGNLTHVGWCTDKPVVGMVQGHTNAGLPPFYWTRSTKPTGHVPPLGYYWDAAVIKDNRFVEIGLSNTSPTPIRIDRLEWAVVDRPFELAELMWDKLDQALPWQPLKVDALVKGGSPEAPGTASALVPLPVTASENRHLVFRVLATDPQQPDNVIRGIGQAEIAAAVQPQGDGR